MFWWQPFLHFTLWYLHYCAGEVGCVEMISKTQYRNSEDQFSADKLTFGLQLADIFQLDALVMLWTWLEHLGEMSANYKLNIKLSTENPQFYTATATENDVTTKTRYLTCIRDRAVWGETYMAHHLDTWVVSADRGGLGMDLCHHLAHALHVFQPYRPPDSNGWPIYTKHLVLTSVKASP